MTTKQTDPGLAVEELERQAAEDGLNSEDGGFTAAAASSGAASRAAATQAPAIVETSAPNSNQNTPIAPGDNIPVRTAAQAKAEAAAKNGEPVSLGSPALDAAFGKVETAPAQTGSGNATQTTAKPIEKSAAALTIPDDQLVIFNGREVNYGEIKNLTYFKEEFDKKDAELKRQAAVLDGRKKSVDEVMNYIDPILNAPGGKVFLETFSATGDLGKSIDVVSPLIGRAQAPIVAAQQAAAHPALVPPKDREGNPLPTDDPEYLNWQATVQGPELARNAAREVIAEAEAQRKARETAAQAEFDRKAKEVQAAQTFRNGVREKNLGVLDSLGDVLKEKGVDLVKLGVTKDQFNAELSKTLDYAAKEGEMDLRNGTWLEEHTLTQGQLRTLVDASGLTTRLQRVNENPLDPAAIAREAELARQKAGTNGQPVADSQRARPIGALGPGDTTAAAPQGKARTDPRQGVEEAREELLRTAAADNLGFIGS